MSRDGAKVFSSAPGRAQKLSREVAVGPVNIHSSERCAVTTCGEVRAAGSAPMASRSASDKHWALTNDEVNPGHKSRSSKSVMRIAGGFSIQMSEFQVTDKNLSRFLNIFFS
jgi:hypothetical protein